MHRLIEESAVLTDPLAQRFVMFATRARWLKGLSILVVLALSVQALDTALLLVLPAVLCTYLVKFTASRVYRRIYYDHVVQLVIAWAEWLAFTLFLCYLAMSYGRVPSELLLIYIWPSYRIGENAASPHWIAIVLTTILAIITLPWLGGQQALFTKISDGLINSAWFLTISVFLFLLRRHIAYRELAARLRRSLDLKSLGERTLRDRSLFKHFADRALSQTGCDIVVLYPWTVLGSAPEGSPIVSCRPGVRLQMETPIISSDRSQMIYVIEHFTKQHEPYFSEDVPHDHNIQGYDATKPSELNFLRAEGIASLCALPVMLGEYPVAVVWISYRYHVKFDEGLREKMKVMGESMASFLAIAGLRSLSERSKLMRWLHDELNNSLRLASGSLSQGLVEPASERVNDAINLISMMIHDVQVPGLLNPGELKGALLRVAKERGSSESRLPTVHWENWEERSVAKAGLSDAQVRALYYCLAGALRNVFQHADARNVWLEAVPAGRGLAFKVQDDGQGFHLSREPKSGGLWVMREQVETAGGVLVVDARPGHGTTVKVVVQTDETILWRQTRKSGGLWAKWRSKLGR